MSLILPAVDHYFLDDGSNVVVQRYTPKQMLNDYAIVGGNPFKVTSNGIEYFLTSDPGSLIPEECKYLLLTSKKPTVQNFREGTIRFKRWLRHPAFQATTPQAVVISWENTFQFIKEDEAKGIMGLRPPQLGALFAILAHVQHMEERAIVVMPTGTGKTEVMLSALVALRCGKLLVTVPSDALRSQLGLKFLTLGLLREFGIVSPGAETPIVGIMKKRFTDRQAMVDFFAACNVIVTTMPLLAGLEDEFQALIAAQISHLFVDEAHHSEAETWRAFISKVHFSKTFLFTATPFRTDERRLQGRFIFNFPLRAAQEQRYYKKINFLPVREYEPKKADSAIAAKAMEQLRKDREAGFPHLVMARCGSKKRALEVAPLYETYVDFKTVVIFTNAPGLSQKIKEVKRKQYDVIVCVDMLGEGFDLPELKIAAIHDERQSIPVTLQFVGRFTRSSFEKLGEASFVVNVAFPPVRDELDRLYAHDADWNLLLPNLSEQATEKQVNFKTFLDGFDGLENSVIPFQNIRPPLSTVIFTYGGSTWNPRKWEEGIPDIDKYDHRYSKVNGPENTLVIILGRITSVDWGNFDVVQNMEWHLMVVFWDRRPGINRVFLNSSIETIRPQKLLEAIFPEPCGVISGTDVFRIFHNVKRLAIYNFGARPQSGGDISFRSFFGRGVRDGLRLLEEGTLIKNNIFGAGFKDGEPVTLGCSISGKVWSYRRGNLKELTDWCRVIGDVITDEKIDTNTVLRNTLFPRLIGLRPQVFPVTVDWNPFMYGRAEEGFNIVVEDVIYDLSNAQLDLIEIPIDADLRFALVTEETFSTFELQLRERTIGEETKPFFQFVHVGGPAVKITYGRTEGEDLAQFFTSYGPIFWFADGSQLMQNQYVIMRDHPGRIPLDNIIKDEWKGVDLAKESQGIAPYEQDSIQYRFIDKIRNDFELIYDDDAAGEIADIIGINSYTTYIDVHLYHLKFALKGAVSNNIDNLYQVCGQAQKSLHWKHRNGRDFFRHLLRRKDKIKKGNTCSRLIKGSEEDLGRLHDAAKWQKEMRFHIYIVQPGFAKAKASDDILLLLGTTYHYLSTVGNVELKVYSS